MVNIMLVCWQPVFSLRVRRVLRDPGNEVESLPDFERKTDFRQLKGAFLLVMICLDHGASKEPMNP